LPLEISAMLFATVWPCATVTVDLRGVIVNAGITEVTGFAVEVEERKNWLPP
jgi:hypothetical protein